MNAVVGWIPTPGNAGGCGDEDQTSKFKPTTPRATTAEAAAARPAKSELSSDKAEGRPGTTSGGGRAVSVRVRVRPDG
ncbi:hypothetical protein PGT21_024641 [Puccinia graminis f. sp. tritici]|uniref:Uncharacterized protein n=1 Tax=Puccinia graminis f. sp. tritici TaxID=56615 RepID=A0A5B0MS48_PUCGR|nr:hypothetical protein PGT21_024641 [Puccinia graminis f. sp. tritici]